MGKLIVISADALVYEDLRYMQQLPAMGYLLKNGSLVKRMKSVHPTLTYPCHATMRTGCYPEKHGVLHNTYMIPGEIDPAWMWYHEVLQCPDLFDACKCGGLVTASVGWPSTGKHPNIDYLVDEVAGLKVKTKEAFYGYYTSTGTPQELYEEVVAKHIHIRYNQPDNVKLFNTEAACEIIRNKKPDLLLLHVGDPDSTRHKYGVFGKEVYPALVDTDMLIGKILTAARESGEEYNIVVTADHGQVDTTRYVYPNALLAQNGLIKTDDKGAVLDCKAWCHSSGMTTMVYLKDPSDTETYQKVKTIFEEKIAQGDSGIYAIRTKQEAAADHLTGEFTFVLETDGHTAFGDDWHIGYERPHADGKLLGRHGYHPDIGPRPPFVGCGPAFRKGVVLEHGNLVDGAPTYAQVLGVELPDVQGKALKELLA